MISRMIIVCLLLSTITVNAQAKKVKPIKLQGLTDNHRISFEMDKDIFYFTSLDLLNYFAKTNDKNIEGAVKYLKSYGKEIAFKKGQANFRNAGERTLYTAIETNLKSIVLSGKACDIVKEGKKPNLFLVIDKCPSDSTKQSFTEKKGRIVLDCL